MQTVTVDAGERFQQQAIAADLRGEHAEAGKLWLQAAEHTADNARAAARAQAARNCFRRAERVATLYVPAFSLMEVLVAIAIFALGAVAVASIFPVAVYLQRETIESVQAAQAAGAMESMIRGRPIVVGPGSERTEWQNPTGAMPNPMDSVGIPGEESWGGTSDNWRAISPIPITLADEWSLSDRSFPNSSEVNPVERDFYWVPLVFDSDPEERGRTWWIYYFVMKRESNVDYTDPSHPFPRVYPALEADPTQPGYYPAGLPGLAYMAVTPVADDPADPDDFARFNFTNSTVAVDGGRRILEAGDRIVCDYGGLYKVVSADATGVAVDGPLKPNPYAPAANTYASRIWFAPFHSAQHVWIVAAREEVQGTETLIHLK